MKIKIAVANQKGGAGKTTTTMLLAGALASDTYKVAVVDIDSQGSSCLWAQASEGRFPATVVSATAATLTKVLDDLNEFDLVLIDCPLNATAAETLAALSVATLAVVPCLPSAPDYWATFAMVNVIELRFPKLPKLVVVNQMTNTSLAKEMAAHIESSWPTARARLGSRTAYREAAAYGLSLRQLPGRPNLDAITELEALSIEILTTSLKAAQ